MSQILLRCILYLSLTYRLTPLPPSVIANHSFLAIPIISWIISEYVLLGVTILYCFILRKLDSTNFMSEELADHDKRILEYKNENANI